MSNEFNNYQSFVLNLEADAEDVLDAFLASSRHEQIKTIRLLHAVLGLASEAGEFADQLKRCLIYGKDLDETNVAEELGDGLWYSALGAAAIGCTLAEIHAANRAKLAARHGRRYNPDHLETRNPEDEREAIRRAREDGL